MYIYICMYLCYWEYISVLLEYISVLLEYISVLCTHSHRESVVNHQSFNPRRLGFNLGFDARRTGRNRLALTRVGNLSFPFG